MATDSQGPSWTRTSGLVMNGKRSRACRQTTTIPEIALTESSGSIIRTFDTGATRDQDQNKLDFEGFLHPLFVLRFGEYMHKHRKQPDGNMRASDNWQKGIPESSLMQSGWRHFLDWWMSHRGYLSREGVEDAICGLIFNAQAYLVSKLQARGYSPYATDIRSSQDT